MSFPWTSPSPNSSRHLLRALLRECSYLPDSAARQYCRHWVLSRFKAYHSTQRQGKALLTDPDRTRRLLRKGFKALRYLRRAAEGDHSCLQGILRQTYARSGRRKRELIRPLLAPDSQEAASAPPLLPGPHGRRLPSIFSPLQRTKGSTGDDVLELSISPRFGKLRALLASQRKNTYLNRETANLKRLVYHIPARNAWGRPMPVRRQKRLIRKWYAFLLNKTLVPLPEPEWTRLKELVSGGMPWEGAPKRRTKAGAQAEETALGHVEAALVEAMHRNPTVKEGRAGFRRREPPSITHRFMRRQWALVFAQCPLLRLDPMKSTWAVEWGSPKPSSSAHSFPAGLFAGVDQRGRPVQAPSSGS